MRPDAIPRQPGGEAGLVGFRLGYGRARRAYLGILATIWEMSEPDLLDWRTDMNIPRAPWLGPGFVPSDL